MVTLKQYQDFCQIPSGTTDLQYKKEMVELLGMSSNLTEQQLDKELKLFSNQVVVSQKKHKHIYLNGIWYKVDRDLHKLKFRQWIIFDSIMTNTEKDEIHKNLINILSVFLRPCRFFKLLPKTFTEDIYNSNLLVVKDMDVRVALELVNFFFRNTMNSIQSTNTRYLEKLEKTTYQIQESPNFQEDMGGI